MVLSSFSINLPNHDQFSNLFHCSSRYLVLFKNSILFPSGFYSCNLYAVGNDSGRKRQFFHYWYPEMTSLAMEKMSFSVKNVSFWIDKRYSKCIPYTQVETLGWEGHRLIVLSKVPCFRLAYISINTECWRDCWLTSWLWFSLFPISQQFTPRSTRTSCQYIMSFSTMQNHVYYINVRDNEDANCELALDWYAVGLEQSVSLTLSCYFQPSSVKHHKLSWFSNLCRHNMQWGTVSGW